jgi:L-fuconolactonase
MWGSDWPVVKLAGGFTQWRDASLELIPQAAQPDILGDTAARFYGIA